MHRAPAVSYRVVRSIQHLALVGALWASGIFSLLLLGATHPLSLLEMLAICIGMVLCSAMAFSGWLQSPVGLLRWDGTHWQWDGFAEESACTLVLRIDLQGLMLVTVTSPGGQRAWLWLARNTADVQWRALRRAVVA